MFLLFKTNEGQFTIISHNCYTIITNLWGYTSKCCMACNPTSPKVYVYPCPWSAWLVRQSRVVLVELLWPGMAETHN